MRNAYIQEITVVASDFKMKAVPVNVIVRVKFIKKKICKSYECDNTIKKNTKIDTICRICSL